VFRRPRRETASDDERSVARPSGTLTLATLPGAEVAVLDLLPAR
jgi:hypothetical protein